MKHYIIATSNQELNFLFKKCINESTSKRFHVNQNRCHRKVWRENNTKLPLQHVDSALTHPKITLINSCKSLSDQELNGTLNNINDNRHTLSARSDYFGLLMGKTPSGSRNCNQFGVFQIWIVITHCIKISACWPRRVEPIMLNPRQGQSNSNAHTSFFFVWN